MLKETHKTSVKGRCNDGAAKELGTFAWIGVWVTERRNAHGNPRSSERNDDE
jgi:hypothetical protein